MIKAYLWLNAGLYFFLVLWCTAKASDTSRALGYLTLSSSGHSEYLVIYGGLQLGLALFFAYLAHSASLHATGIVFSLLIYAPIVVYRLATVVRFHPVSTITLGTGALETLLLAGAVVLFFRR